MKLLVIAALAALAATSAQITLATPSFDGPSITVRYGDLDLSSDQGARLLYQRLQDAAGKVCVRPDPGIVPLVIKIARQRTFDACVRRALNSAVARLNQPGLSAYVVMNTHD